MYGELGDSGDMGRINSAWLHGGRIFTSPVRLQRGRRKSGASIFQHFQYYLWRGGRTLRGGRTNSKREERRREKREGEHGSGGREEGLCCYMPGIAAFACGRYQRRASYCCRILYPAARGSVRGGGVRRNGGARNGRTGGGVRAVASLFWLAWRDGRRAVTPADIGGKRTETGAHPWRAEHRSVAWWLYRREERAYVALAPRASGGGGAKKTLQAHSGRCPLLSDHLWYSATIRAVGLAWRKPASLNMLSAFPAAYQTRRSG